MPVGISYWHHGQFWPYHHNPPLIRLAFAIPAVVADVPTDYSAYYPVLRSREVDLRLGRDFMWANREHYIGIYALSRAVVAAISVLGGYLVFRWSRELFGNVGALLSLTLWVLCPNVLAHAGLATPDLGATVLGFLATYLFWRYLKSPSAFGAIVSSVFLGLAEASKFSFVVLPLAWIVLAVVKVWVQRRKSEFDRVLNWKRATAHAALVTVTSLLVLNTVYLWEGTGCPLGSFVFHSRTLTIPLDPEDPNRVRRNRFRGTVLAQLPVPLPEHYALGLDDQLFDLDRKGYWKYLRGELREPHQEGWWHYYFYAFLVKTPLGTLAILAVASAALLFRQCRREILSEAALLLPILAFLLAVSSQTLLNSHLRYILPAFPFAFVFAGRVAGLIAARRRLRIALLMGVVACNGLSVIRVHPHYLAYFNEAAGGPANALEHLADSNIDWGQGLIALREWLDEHAPGQKIRLAYFGFVDPEVLDIDYELPPLKVPAPGLQAVSANYLMQIPFVSPDSKRGLTHLSVRGLTYYRRFEPIAMPGWSIYVYDLSVEDVNQVRRERKLPPLPADEVEF